MYKLTIILFLFFCNAAAAQSGVIRGRVTDASGKPLPGAGIIIAGTLRGTTASSSGSYVLSGLKPGTYSIEASMIGYKRQTSQAVELNNNEITLNFTLEETAIQSGQVIVTAGKFEQQLLDLPVSAAVISGEDISRKNFISLDQALRYAPGVSMNFDQVSIRGSSGYSRGAGTRVLVAFDGIPLYTGDTGEIIWEIIPVTEIERTEIIKGAASSLYGSTAIGGVINVISRNVPANPFTYIKAYAGAFDKPAYKEWDWSGQYRPFNGLTLTHTQRFGKLGIAGSVTRTENLSYRQNDFLKRYTGYLKASYDFSESSALKLFGTVLDQHRGNFVYWKDAAHVLEPPDADQGQRVNASRFMLGMIYSQKTGSNTQLNIRGSLYNTKWRDQTTSGNSSTTRLYRGEVQLNHNLSERAFLVSGAEVSSGSVNSNLFGKPGSFGYGLYTQAEYKFSFPLTFTAGLRYDYSRLDTLNGISSLSPKAGLNYKLSETTILRAAAGRGFRAPTLAEAFTTTTASGIRILPNPNLTSESNITVEAGINHSFSEHINLDAAVFSNDYFDFIQPEVSTQGIVRFQNVTRARILGLETALNLNVIPSLLTMNINYVLLNARDIEKKKALKYRPRHMAYTSVNLFLNPFQFGTDFRYWSRIEELDTELVDIGLVPDGGKRVAVYVLDLRAGFNLTSIGIPGTLNLNINNILNYNYIEIIGNLSPIRNAVLSLELAF